MAKKTDVTKSSKKDTGKDQKKKGGIRKYFRELKAETKKSKYMVPEAFS